METAPSARPWVVGEVERTWLDDGSWLDLGRGWLADPAEVYDALASAVAWRQGSVWKYDHAVPEPRLSGSCRRGALAPHPAVAAADRALRARYGPGLQGISMGLYRDGRDAMGSHRDSDLRFCEDTVVAILTLGAQRPWVLTPRGGRVPVLDVAPAAGDLLVMGGRAQADWLHGVPPAPGVRSGRMSLQWRWTSGRGRPEVGPASGAPRRWGSTR